MLNIYIYTNNKIIYKNEYKTINDFFIKYNTKCKIEFTSEYAELARNILDIDIIFIYDDVWEDAYRIIELQAKEIDKSNKEIYLIKTTSPLNTEKLEKNKNKLLPQDTVISLNTKSGKIKMKSKDIIYFENMQRIVVAHTIHGTLEITSHIRELEKTLETESFISSYISILVNLYWIKTISGYDIHLKNNEIIPLSQKKSSSFRKKHKQYLKMSS